MTFFLAMSSAVHSQLDTPEKQNVHQPLCTRPKETPLKELVETKVDDKTLAINSKMSNYLTKQNTSAIKIQEML